jgi:hypothetical protein
LDKNQGLQAYNEKVRQQKKIFNDVFTSANGQVILEALREEFYDCAILHGDGMEFKLGQRDVVYQILDRLDKL